MPIPDTTSTSIPRRTEAFVLRWMKQILVALIFVALAAIWATTNLAKNKEKSSEEIIAENSKAVVVITVFGKNHDPIRVGKRLLRQQGWHACHKLSCN